MADFATSRTIRNETARRRYDGIIQGNALPTRVLIYMIIFRFISFYFILFRAGIISCIVNEQRTRGPDEIEWYRIESIGTRDPYISNCNDNCYTLFIEIKLKSTHRGSDSWTFSKRFIHFFTTDALCLPPTLSLSFFSCWATENRVHIRTNKISITTCTH